jgi:protocatechuate 3,4-dioxygenase beta subunit
VTRAVNRRHALAAFGTAGLGALLFACGQDGDGSTASTQTDPTAANDPTSTTTGSSTTAASGGSATTLEALDAAGSCSLTPEMTEGPYYFDVDAMRDDIREDREGATLKLAVRVRDAETCDPIANAVVDIWHCDANGLYSGFEAASTGSGGGGGPGGASGPTDDETYLRGALVTDADGVAEFTTVYPGWYRGRTVHIHAKVHLDNSTLVTTQLFFDDAFSEVVYEQEPYASNTGRDTFNDDDSIFDDAMLLTLSEDGDGYLGAINLDVEAS